MHRVGPCLSLLPLFEPLVKQTLILDRHIVPILKVSVLETVDCTASINANTFHFLLISVRILQLFSRGAYQEFYMISLKREFKQLTKIILPQKALAPQKRKAFST